MRIRNKVSRILDYGLTQMKRLSGKKFVEYLYLIVNDADNHCVNDHRCVVSVNNKSVEVALNEIVLRVPQKRYSYKQLICPAGSIVNVEANSIEKLSKDTIFHFCSN